MITLIATVGGRDISLSNAFKSKLFASNPELFKNPETPFPRKLGSFLNQNDHWRSVIDEIGIPIILPAIRKTLELQGDHTAVDECCLVVTNQTDPKFIDTDTIEFGALIRNMLMDASFKVKQGVSVKSFLKPIQINQNPNYLDNQFDFFKKKLDIPGDSFTAALGKSEKIYLCAQGGIDAINTALLLNLLNKYGDKVVPLNVNEGSGLVTPVQIFSRMNSDIQKKLIRRLIDRFDYSALLEFNECGNDFEKLAGYANARINFDFVAARRSLSQLDNRYSTEKAKLELDISIEGDEEALTRELISNAEIKWQQGAYVDFLLRLFRILEQIGKLHVIKTLDGFIWSDNEWGTTLNEYLKTDDGLKAHLENYRINMNGEQTPLRYSTKNPNIPIYIAIAEYFAKRNETSGLVWEILIKGQPLTILRNQSIGAHNFAPVSKHIIENILFNNNTSVEIVLTNLKKLFSISENPFSAINVFMLRLVR